LVPFLTCMIFSRIYKADGGSRTLNPGFTKAVLYH
jgi:hypothetical protein